MEVLQGQIHVVGAFLNEDNERIEIINEVYSIEWEEREIRMLKELLGDGKAKVTVGSELKKTADYQSAGATVTVQITCDQDKKVIRQAVRLIGPTVAKLAQQHVSASWKALQEIVR